MAMLAVNELGEGGTPLVLLHGLFGNARNLGAVARELSAYCRVLSLDLPGHGASPHAQAYALESMADAVYRTLQAQAIHQFSLLGHSLGGKVAMQLALHRPQQVCRLLVADIAPVRYAPAHDEVFAALHRVGQAKPVSRDQADALLAQSLPEAGLRQFLLQNLRRGDNGFSWRFDFEGLERDYQSLSAALHGQGRSYAGPVLFVAGAQSDYLEARHHDACLALFPNARFERIEDAGHWVHADQPGRFRAIAQKFFIPE